MEPRVSEKGLGLSPPFSLTNFSLTKGFMLVYASKNNSANLFQTYLLRRPVLRMGTTVSLGWTMRMMIADSASNARRFSASYSCRS